MIGSNTRVGTGLAILLTLGLSAKTMAAARSFTPTSLLFSISSIHLESSADSTKSIEIFKCSSTTNEGCLVDLASAAAIESLISGTGAVQAGTYDQIRVSRLMGDGSSSGIIKIKGSVDIGGTTYYTQSGTTPLTTTAANIGYVTLTGVYAGANVYKLPSSVTLAAGDSLTITAIAPVTNFTAAANGGTSCPATGVQVSDGTLSVCSMNPDLIPSVGDVKPTVETYLISGGAGSAASTASYQLQLFINPATSEPIGGQFLPYAVTTSVSSSCAGMLPLKTYVKTGSTYELKTPYSTTTDTVAPLQIDTFTRASAGASANYSIKRSTNGTSVTSTETCAFHRQ